jgi:hypothetical protein
MENKLIKITDMANQTKIIPESLHNKVIALMKYSFEPIDFDYNKLNNLEKQLMTKEDFEQIKKICK